MICSVKKIVFWRVCCVFSTGEVCYVSSMSYHRVLIPFSFPLSPLASAATLVNIRNARKHFEKIERLDSALQVAGPPRVQ